MLRGPFSHLVLVLITASVHASQAIAGPQVAQEVKKPKEIWATRVERPPSLDGTLNDPLWQQAQPITDFKQREPVEGTEPTEKTEVRVLYDTRHVYFGIFCYDSDPQRIVAAQLRRDLEMRLDDSVQIMIDPVLSRRNGYIFQVNPLGTQRDGLITEEQSYEKSGGDFVPNWDGLWVSAARVNDRGWTATIQIPFSTLNFKARGGEAEWGINFRRFIRRKNEEDLWGAYWRLFGMWRISEAGRLKGLSNVAATRLLIVKPYAVGGTQSLTGQTTNVLHTGGLDIKYGIRPSLLTQLTLNTDFADADVDQQQFNLTPYQIFFPEKRAFFLENSDVFTFWTWHRDLLFFSRQVGIDSVTGQVVPVDGGAKVVGKLGGFDVGLMDVKTRASGPNPYANYSVIRVKRSLLENSYVGIIAVDKESGNRLDRFNRAWGADWKFVFYKQLTIDGFYAKTWSPNLRGKDYTAGAGVEYRSNLVKFVVGHATIQPNFNAEVGFTTRTDDDPTYLDFNLTPRPKSRGVRELSFESKMEHSPSVNGTLQSLESQTSFRALFHNGAVTDNQVADVFYQRLEKPFNIYKNTYIPAGNYRFTRHQVMFSSPEDRRLTFSAQERWGGYYTGTLNELTVKSQYRPNARLSVSLSNVWNAFRLQQGNFDITLAGLQLSYAFTRFLNATTFIQVNTAEHEAASANFRIRYTYRPDCDLYVIYNVGSRFQSLAAENPVQLREQRFVVKLTYSFAL